MASSRFTGPVRSIGWLGIALLVATHLVMFRQFYLGKQTLPWDFPMAYFGVTAYFTSALSNGLWPEWMPFQSMGYPFLVNPQSGAFYPVFWLFPLLQVPYSLHAANIVAVLHVAFASVGMAVLARRFTPRLSLCLIAAAAYHFFGGFYSNAEHADIARAFAWIPWLFWCVTIDVGAQTLPRRALATPLILVFVITGSYAGNVVSHLFVLGLYVLGQIALAPSGTARRTAMKVPLLVGLGTLMAAPMIAPAMAFKSLTVRGTTFVVEAGRMNWDIRNWPSLVLPWNLAGFVHDHSMISAFVGAPVMLLLLLGTRASWSKCWLWLGVAGVAVTMAPGSSSLVFRALTAVVPMLRVSRFSSSDYRGLLACALIILAIAALDAFLASSLNERLALLRLRAPLLAVVALLAASGLWPIDVPGILVRGLFLLTAGTLAVVLAVDRVRWFDERVAMVALLGLVLLAGHWATRNSMMSWRGGDPVDHLKQEAGVAPDDELPIRRALREPPATRPARTPWSERSWVGSVNGSYQMSDLGGFVITSRAAVEADPVLKAFMAEAWRPVVLTGQSQAPDCDALKLALREPRVADELVISKRYGNNAIDYEVRLATPTVVIENELFFPGWSGHWSAGGQEVVLESFAVCGALRGWVLPAGTGSFRAEFRTPYVRPATGAAAMGLASYLVVIIASTRRRFRVV